jgi:hypothetical protein
LTDAYSISQLGLRPTSGFTAVTNPFVLLQFPSLLQSANISESISDEKNRPDQSAQAVFVSFILFPSQHHHAIPLILQKVWLNLLLWAIKGKGKRKCRECPKYPAPLLMSAAVSDY